MVGFPNSSLSNLDSSLNTVETFAAYIFLRKYRNSKSFIPEKENRAIQ